MALTFGRDHGAIAWGHWLAQFQGKPGLEAMTRSLFGPLNTLDLALRDLLLARSLETAAGQQLDGIGSIVGQARTISRALYLAFFGFTEQVAGRGFGIAPMRRENQDYAGTSLLGDEQYRVILRLKIALNNAHGTTPEILAACQTIFAEQMVVVENVGDATLWIAVGRFLTASDVLYDAAKGFIPRAAGVGMTVFHFDKTAPFGFAEQGYQGFGQGILARLITDDVFSHPALWNEPSWTTSQW